MIPAWDFKKLKDYQIIFCVLIRKKDKRLEPITEILVDLVLGTFFVSNSNTMVSRVDENPWNKTWLWFQNLAHTTTIST